MKIDFRNFLKREEYKQIFDVYKEEFKKDNQDFERLNNVDKIFHKKLIAYLKEMAKNNFLKLPNSGTHESRFLNTLINLTKNKLKDKDVEDVEYMFDSLFPKLLNQKDQLSESESYEKFIKMINDGNFKPYEINCDIKCLNCDQKFHLAIKNWEIFLMKFQYKENHKSEFVLAKECIEKQLQQVKVEFKTGHLLVADWFRIPEFTEQVEYNKEYTQPSINSILGQIKSTEHAANLGFITIHVGNSSPTIFQKGEDFIFGHQNEDIKNTKKGNDSYQEKGYVCTDLWNVTIIDKSTLIEIIAQKLGEEKAIKKVEKYLQEENNINQIQITPGTYIVEYIPKKYINTKNELEEIPEDINVLFKMKKEILQKKLKI